MTDEALDEGDLKAAGDYGNGKDIWKKIGKTHLCLENFSKSYVKEEKSTVRNNPINYIIKKEAEFF